MDKPVWVNPEGSIFPLVLTIRIGHAEPGIRLLGRIELPSIVAGAFEGIVCSLGLEVVAEGNGNFRGSGKGNPNLGPHHGDDDVVSRIVHGQTQVGVVLELHILVYLIEQLDGSRCEVREELLSCIRIDRIRDGRDEIQEDSVDRVYYTRYGCRLYHA